MMKTAQAFVDRYKMLKSAIRMVLGLVFLWAFIDKVFGLGFATETDKAWLNGGSPAAGFLEFGTSGPFASMYQSMAGNPFVDWLYMLGLFGIGLALLFGIGVKIASYSGALMMLLIWLAVLPPEHHPFIDEHILYALVLIWMSRLNQANLVGLGGWWSKLQFVQKRTWLQ